VTGFISAVNGNVAVVKGDDYPKFLHLATELGIPCITSNVDPGRETGPLTEIIFGLSLCFPQEFAERGPRTFTVSTKQSTYHLSILVLGKSSVLKDHEAKGMFAYDFDDKDGVFGLVDDFLHSKRGSIAIHPENFSDLEKTVTDLQKIATDLGIAPLAKRVAKYKEKWSRNLRILDERQKVSGPISWVTNKLLSLTNENVDGLSEEFLDSRWTSSVRDVQELAANLILVGRIRPMNVEVLADFVFHLNERKPDLHLSDILLRRILADIEEGYIDCARFLWTLYSRGVVALDPILNFFSAEIRRSGPKFEDRWRFYNWGSLLQSFMGERRAPPLLAILWFLPDLQKETYESLFGTDSQYLKRIHNHFVAEFQQRGISDESWTTDDWNGGTVLEDSEKVARFPYES
jgi:hypothetical protein